MYPDPGGGTKTYGTLLEGVQIERQEKKEGRGRLGKWSKRGFERAHRKDSKRVQSLLERGQRSELSGQRGRGVQRWG
jgi:hypothetical protein